MWSERWMQVFACRVSSKVRYVQSFTIHSFSKVYEFGSGAWQFVKPSKFSLFLHKYNPNPVIPALWHITVICAAQFPLFFWWTFVTMRRDFLSFSDAVFVFSLSLCVPLPASPPHRGNCAACIFPPVNSLSCFTGFEAAIDFKPVFIVLVVDNYYRIW